MNLNYYKMCIYKLLRNEEIDKQVRPAIFLSYFGNQSLVWWRTTVKSTKTSEIPISIILNKKITYFYSNGIEKVETKNLIHPWRNLKTNKIINLNINDQHKFLQKFSQCVNLEDPYKTIVILRIENKNLKEENEQLKNEINKLKIQNNKKRSI